MAIIRMQNNVPEVYVQSSRDFQFLCRLHDVSFNQIKLDADLLQHLTCTKTCKNNMLTLLQTKLGYFTKYEYTDDMMRYFLSVFPQAIKCKGTIQAIRYCVNAFIKAENIKDEVIVENDSSNNFNILIKTKHKLTDTVRLEELLSYVIPIGLTYEFQIYNTIPTITTTETSTSNNSSFVVADKKANAAVRYSNSEFYQYSVNTVPSSAYSLTHEEPADWATYTNYYKYVLGSYIQLTSPEPWAANSYYRKVDSSVYDMSINNVGLGAIDQEISSTYTKELSGDVIEEN